MLRGGWRWPLLVTGLLAVAPAGAAADKEELARDLETLRGAGVDTDGAGLLKFFRTRTLAEADREKIGRMIRQLGDDDFEVREKASKALVEIGPVARAQLKEAVGSTNPEVRTRARRCLALAAKRSDPALLSAAARVLAERRPAGAAGVLLDYLPSADDPDVAEEVRRSLGAVGFPGGKADPALVKALADKLPARRSAAAEVLALHGGEAHRPAVRKLLKDGEVRVRERVALALVRARDKEAVPVLIALLTEPGVRDVEAVEDLLDRLSAEKGPRPPEEGSEEARKKYRTAWEKWWKDKGRGVDLAKVELRPRFRGYLLIARVDVRGVGEVVELDRAGKERWKITGLSYPVRAQVVGRDRVLVCEFNGGKVTERTTKGEAVWEKSGLGQVLGAQRLRNGHTFVTTRNVLLEYDRAGKEVARITPPGGFIYAAAKGAEGQIGVITARGQFERLDASGKALKRFAVGRVYPMGCSVQMLPKGRVLVAQYTASRVVEYDEDGKAVWQATVMRPTSVRRLPNGQTIVTSRFTRQVVVLDKEGRQVSSKTLDGQVLFADQR